MLSRTLLATAVLTSFGVAACGGDAASDEADTEAPAALVSDTAVIGPANAHVVFAFGDNVRTTESQIRFEGRVHLIESELRIESDDREGSYIVIRANGLDLSAPGDYRVIDTGGRMPPPGYATADFVLVQGEKRARITNARGRVSIIEREDGGKGGRFTLRSPNGGNPISIVGSFNTAR